MMRNQRFKSLKIGIGFFLFSACMGSVEVTELSCDFNPEEHCGTCDHQVVYYCVCSGANSVEIGFDEANACSSGTHCGFCPGGTSPMGVGFQCPAVENPTPTEGAYACGSWDPGSLITVVSTNNYGVDSGLIYELETDPTPLYACDAARINVDTGSLIVQDAVSTDMVYLLGLRNGDKLLEMNGMSIDGPYDAAIAYATLWVNQAESNYTLKVLRSTNFVYLDYEILVSKP